MDKKIEIYDMVVVNGIRGTVIHIYNDEAFVVEFEATENEYPKIETITIDQISNL